MPPSIERRVYGPDSSPEEIAAIQARLSRYNADTFVWEEMPIQSPFSVEVMLREIQRQTANLPSFNLVVNGKPNHRRRKFARRCIGRSTR